MFLLDPDEGLTREELLQKIWHVRFTPDHRAQVLEIADGRGITWLDVLREKAAQFDDMLESPSEHAEWVRTCKEMNRRAAMPFGSDPRREQDGDR